MKAIRWCLADAGLVPDDLDHVAINSDPRANRWRKLAYLFAYRSADHTGPPVILFDYGENRSGEHVREFLGDWRGKAGVDRSDNALAVRAAFARELRLALRQAPAKPSPESEPK